MDASYIVEYEQYYEVLRPLKLWTRYQEGGQIKLRSNVVPVGTILKGKDLYAYWKQRPDVGRRVIQLYRSDASRGSMIRPLAHQVFF